MTAISFMTHSECSFCSRDYRRRLRRIVMVSASKSAGRIIVQPVLLRIQEVFAVIVLERAFNSTDPDLARPLHRCTCIRAVLQELL